MNCGKLSVVLINALAAEKNGTANGAIAAFILENLRSIAGMGIQEMASRCNVSNSSISRFCRDMGLEGYSELQQLIGDWDDRVDFGEVAETEHQRAVNYADRISAALRQVASGVDMRQIHRLCEDIRSCRRVAVFGMLKSEGAAISLQSDLLKLGKQVYTCVSYPQQMNYIHDAAADDLIILFSYQGLYLESDYRRIFAEKKRSRIYCITCGELKAGDFYDEVIHVESDLQWYGHPFVMEYMAGLIAQEYSVMFG